MTDIKYRPSNFSATASNVVVGFDDDLLAIKEQLCGESPSLQVIPISGMGGVGKTTLARNAYHDRLTREVFDIGGWVTLSQSYSLQDIFSSLAHSLTLFNARRYEESDENEEAGVEIFKELRNTALEAYIRNTALEVYKRLKGRKYVVVIDDIWNTKAWDEVKMLFPDDHNGSRIILTTRLLDVATYVNGCTPHEMQLMHPDQSWNLLRHMVFMDGVCYHELEDIGMEIARSCGGLPLAVVVIAGLLSTVDKTRASWEEIAGKVNPAVTAKDGQVEKVLSLSYTHLPRHLRQCFAYMGGFPEDREICVAKLIKLWIAEGFVDGASIASKSLEEEAEERLKDLVKRSLVLVDKRTSRGEIKSFSLHDLIRDLCRRKANEEKFLLYHTYDYRTLVESLRVGSSEDARYTRVIDWSPVGNVPYVLTPDQIFRLSSLRYLVTYSDNLLTAVSYLENLQTLIINPIVVLVHLPPEIWKMQQLKHLVSLFGPLPCPQVASSFPLENLHTLSEMSNFECSYGFVKWIPNIKKLGLVYSRHENVCDYRLQNLKWLHRLEKLKVLAYPDFQGRLDPVFPASLKKLNLGGWKLSWKEMTVVGTLPNLQVLKLTSFFGQGNKWETSEGEFARLSFLLIKESDLQEWKTEPEHFPSLKSLLLHYCWCLHEIPAAVGDIDTLELIEVKGGRRAIISAKQIEEDQKEMGNYSLQVRCTEK